MTAPDLANLPSQIYRSAAVVGRKPLHFTFAPDAAARAQIAAHLSLLGLQAFVLKGVFAPQGRGDVVLRGEMSAQITQACTITLAPVPARITSAIARDYLHDFAETSALEAELGPEDQEPIPEYFDVAAIAIEELALSLPLYPRAKGAVLPPTVAAPAGVAPLTDDALRPFAQLAGLAALMGQTGMGQTGMGQAGGAIAGQPAADSPQNAANPDDAQNTQDPPK